MTTPVASQTLPSHTTSVSGLSLSPECPQVWTKDVEILGITPTIVSVLSDPRIYPHLWITCGRGRGSPSRENRTCG